MEVVVETQVFIKAFILILTLIQMNPAFDTHLICLWFCNFRNTGAISQFN